MAEPPLQFRTHVVRTTSLTPHMRRIVLADPSLAAFPDLPFTDRYVKLAFPRPGADGVPEGDWWALPQPERPILRTYTVRAFDAAAGEVAIDVFLHGDVGIAGRWAAAAAPGDELVMSRPGGAYAPGADAALHLLVGDEAALPAIAAALEAKPAGAPAVVVAEVADPDEQLDLVADEATVVHWLHRRDGHGPDALLHAVEGLTLPTASIQGFVHGELHAVRAIGRHLVVDRGVDRDLLSASGYWRRGKDEDAFQAEKRERVTS